MSARVPERTLVIGLGNPLLSDDGVGVYVARRLRERLADLPGVEVDEDACGGLRLMERLVGFDRGVVVDAIITGRAAPGTLHRLRADALPTQHSASAHDASLATALRFGRQVGAAVPDPGDVVLVGVEAADVTTFAERCTPAVEDAIPAAAAEVVAVLAAFAEADETRAQGRLGGARHGARKGG